MKLCAVLQLSSLNVYRSEKCLQQKLWREIKTRVTLNTLFPLSHVAFDIIKRQGANAPQLLVVTHICVSVIHTYMNTPVLQFWIFGCPPHVGRNDRTPLQACNAGGLGVPNGNKMRSDHVHVGLQSSTLSSPVSVCFFSSETNLVSFTAQ
jgi:hypothetical protein